MIDSESFVALLRRRGVSVASGVPCSYLRPLLADLWDAPDIDTVNAVNEGDAVAVCAGAALGGRPSLAFMQNSGLGNAVNPLASLTWTFRIPLLLLVTLRGDPHGSDEPQHRLMGAITGGLLDLLEIPWEPLPADMDDAEAALDRAERQMQSNRRCYALIVGPNSFRDRSHVHEPASPERSAAPLPELIEVGGRRDALPTRAEALARIVRATPEGRSVVIGSTGYTSRELYALGDRANHFYMVGSMGCAASLGLGVALTRPDVHVVVVEGDGSLLMRLGVLAMVGERAPSNLSHVVLDNGVHESTGAQPTVSPGVRIADVARACGYRLAVSGSGLEVLDCLFAPSDVAGPRLAHLRIRPGTPSSLPRPKVSPEDVRARFVATLASPGPVASAGAGMRR